jgi:hypothetical protein
MIRYQTKKELPVSPENLFDFMVVHQVENHRQWEPEVLEVRRPGPLQVGTKGIMVRREGRSIREVPFEVVELVPNRRVAYRSGSGGFHLHLVFDMSPAGEGTELSITTELTLTGFLRLMTPIFVLAFPKRSRRISGQLAQVIEAKVIEAKVIEAKVIEDRTAA